MLAPISTLDTKDIIGTAKIGPTKVCYIAIMWDIFVHRLNLLYKIKPVNAIICSYAS